MKSIVLIQARTNSSRLPGKVKLLINEIPIVVLAAKRACNKGHKVIVATSSEPEDDELASILFEYNINFFRGELDNVLGRFVMALEGYENESLIIRLTADNIFPDGTLLQEIEGEFISRQLQYICCNGKESGLPYGVSVEMTRLNNLREAIKNPLSAYDKEHVMPFIIRKFGAIYFEKYKLYNWGNLRCTVDYLSDYNLLCEVFDGVNDPIQASFFDLIKKLELVSKNYTGSDADNAKHL